MQRNNVLLHSLPGKLFLSLIILSYNVISFSIYNGIKDFCILEVFYRFHNSRAHIFIFSDMCCFYVDDSIKYIGWDFLFIRLLLSLLELVCSLVFCFEMLCCCKNVFAVEDAYCS